MKDKESQIILLDKNNQAHMQRLNQRIRADQIRLIFEQIPLGLLAQILVALFLFLALYPISNKIHLMFWFIYMMLMSSSWLTTAILFKIRQGLCHDDSWLFLFGLWTTLSSIGWGYLGCVLIPATELVHQTFVVIVILGMTAGANPFFSPVYYIYMLFLFPAFIPFDMWMFAQGGLYVLLGLCGLVYMLVMAGSCMYTYNFLITSLRLRYKNIDLDTLNQFLEKRVAERTRDLEKSLSVTKSTLESTADGIAVVDLQGHIDNYNQKFLDLWHIRAENNIRTTVFVDLLHHFNDLTNAEEILAALTRIHKTPDIELLLELYFRDGRVFDCYSKPHLLRDQIIGRVWNFRDITLRKKLEQQLSYQANHDLLTGLPNRTLLYDRIKQGIAYSRRLNTQMAMFFLDLDNFKLINDNLGHESGDLLLKEIGQRLIECIRQSDTVARFGGDEFVIVFVTGDHKDFQLLAQKILRRITEPVQLINHELVITSSIGISIYPKDGADPDTLLRKADMAMYQAKVQGRNNIQLFEDSITQQSSYSLEMQIQMRNGLEKSEYFLLFQPIYDLKTQQIIAAEALIRWHHPERGIISPTEFIPIAEESGVIVEMGEWVFIEACRIFKQWENLGIDLPYLAINVSAIQLKRHNFSTIVEKTINELKIDPKLIELELTESAMMDNNKLILPTLHKLKNAHIRLTIDDFGTGYSSMNYLRHFPINKIKIDRSFVMECATTANSGAIIEAIVTMGHSMNLTVLAEGIEDEEQLLFLQTCGCDQGQGYWFSPALEPEEFVKLLQKQRLKRIG